MSETKTYFLGGGVDMYPRRSLSTILRHTLRSRVLDGTERNGRCCGLGRPFCSHISAIGDVLHFHFAQGYRLDVMYFE